MVGTWILDRLIAQRRLVLGLIGLVTLIFAAFLPRLEFDSSIEVWFLEDDPDLVGYHDFLERFTADEVVVVGLFSTDGDAFRNDVLEPLAELTERAPDLPWVHRARSITNTSVYELRTEPGRDGEAPTRTIDIAPITERGPPPGQLDDTALADLRARALGNELLAGSLVSEDGRTLALVIELEKEANERIEHKNEMLDALRDLIDDVVDANAAGLDVEVAGGAVLDRAFLEYSQRDFGLLGPLALLLVIVLTFAVFRRWSATLVPLLVVVVANIWMFGLLAMLGRKVDLLSSGLVVLVLAVGIADTVHVLASYDRELVAGAEREAAVRASVLELFVPCLFTSMTTAAGLLSLTVSDLEPIAWFGGMAAVGVTIAFLLSMTFVPVVLAVVPAPPHSHLERIRTGRLHKALTWLGRPTRRTRRIVLAVTVLLVGASVLGVTQMRVGANPMNYFKSGDPIVDAFYRIDGALGGTTTVEFLIDAGDGGYRQLDTVERIDRFETMLAGLPAINHVDSPLDAQRELNRLWTDGRPASAVIPDTPAKLAALWRMVENEDDMRAMLDTDAWRWGRVTVRVPLSDAGKLSDQLPELEADLREHYQDDELHITATGFIKLMSNMERYLVDSQIESLLIAFCVVTLMIGLLLRSPALAVFGMIPNLIPILMGLGFMAAVGISLDPGTVMIGSIALGLVVDDTVHFLVRLRRNLDDGQQLPDAIDATMQQTGRPIVVTSIVLALSFLVLAAGSSFAPNTYFGIVSALIIAFAVIADLVMLPAALLIGRRG